jgi:hypothetical protein
MDAVWVVAHMEAALWQTGRLVGGRRDGHLREEVRWRREEQTEQGN